MPGPIGLVIQGVRLVVHKVQETRAKKAGQSAQPEAKGQGASQSGHPADQGSPAQAPAGKQDATSAAAGGAGYDVEQHVLKHRIWGSRSTQRSYWAMFLIGFAMAFDFTAALMSIQPLYYITGGREKLYGLTFGIYTLSGIIVAPLYGFWSDRRRTFLYPCVLGTFINAAGNLVYAFTFYADRWWVMLIGRAVAGAGSPVLVLGAAYISQMTAFEDRTHVLAQYRVSQSMARMMGPFIGYLFLGLREPKASSPVGLKLFNWYTISGWITFFVVLVLAFVFWGFFKDPTEEERQREQPPASQVVDEQQEVSERAAFRRFMAVFCILQFGFAFSIWAFYSNLFALFAGTFHGVENQSDNWKTFIGTGCGALAGAIVYRRCARKLKQGPERIFWAAAPFLMFISWMLGINYKGNTIDAPSEAQYYAATVLMAVSVVSGFAASEAYFSKKLTQYHRQVGDRWGLHLAILGVVNALGCFAGPLVAGAVTSISTPSGAFACDPEAGTECCITSVRYFVDGCVLHRGVPWNAAMAGVTFVLGLLNLAALWAFGSYGQLGKVAAAAWTPIAVSSKDDATAEEKH